MGFVNFGVKKGLFLVWAYVPEPWLHAIGIFYYPSRSSFLLQFLIFLIMMLSVFEMLGFYYLIFVVVVFFRYWALAVPTYTIVAIVLALSLYIGLNFMSTPSSTSLNTMFGN